MPLIGRSLHDVTKGLTIYSNQQEENNPVGGNGQAVWTGNSQEGVFTLPENMWNFALFLQWSVKSNLRHSAISWLSDWPAFLSVFKHVERRPLILVDALVGI